MMCYLRDRVDAKGDQKRGVDMGMDVAVCEVLVSEYQNCCLAFFLYFRFLLLKP